MLVIAVALNNPVLGHQKKDFLVSANFDSKSVALDDFELVLDPFYGNCYTFNGNGMKRTRRALPGYGKFVLSSEMECLIFL